MVRTSSSLNKSALFFYSYSLSIIHDFDSTLNARTWVQAHDAASALLARRR